MVSDHSNSSEEPWRLEVGGRDTLTSKGSIATVSTFHDYTHRFDSFHCLVELTDQPCQISCDEKFKLEVKFKALHSA